MKEEDKIGKWFLACVALAVIAIGGLIYYKHPLSVSQRNHVLRMH